MIEQLMATDVYYIERSDQLSQVSGSSPHEKLVMYANMRIIWDVQSSTTVDERQHHNVITRNSSHRNHKLFFCRSFLQRLNPQQICFCREYLRQDRKRTLPLLPAVDLLHMPEVRLDNCFWCWMLFVVMIVSRTVYVKFHGRTLL